MLDYSELTWVEHPDNPLIEPPWPEWILADPTFLTPEKSPDKRFHLFAHTLMGIQHYTSTGGLNWRQEASLFQGLRPFLYQEDGQHHLLYERFGPSVEASIALRSSTDLVNWSEPQAVLRPTLPWHGSVIRRIGNPCVVKARGEYWLFYSAGQVLLKDCAFPEPRHLGLAKSSNLEGPYIAETDPFLSPSEDSRYHNLAAGSIKVLYDEKRDKFWGFNNGIWTDEKNQSRSAILLLESDDGQTWRFVHEEPIVGPGEGWSKALVYAMDVRERFGKALLYFNARDGWLFGRERIGLLIGSKGSGQGKSPVG